VAPLKKYARLLIGMAVIAALVTAMRAYSLPHCHEIQAYTERLGALIAPLAFMAAYVIATIAFVPGVVLTLGAGLAFGPVLGTLWVTIAANIGALLSFLIARYLAHDAVAGLLAKQAWFAKFKDGLASNGLTFMLIIRLVPIFPFNGSNYACGLVPLKLRDYVVGSLVGMIPGTIAYVYLGATGCQLIDLAADRRLSFADLPAEVRTNLFIAIAFLLFLSVAPLGLKRLRKRSTAA
jgi:uncharacterized membrane protein YdjX (TVP38/TMEM64 family)